MKKIFVFLLFAAAAMGAENYFEEGSAAYIQGNLDEAMIQIYKAHTLAPADRKVSNLLGQIYIEKAQQAMGEGNYAEASAYLNKAGELKVYKEKVKKLQSAIGDIERKSAPPSKIKPVKPRKKRVTTQKTTVPTVKRARAKKTKPPQKKKTVKPRKRRAAAGKRKKITEKTRPKPVKTENIMPEYGNYRRESAFESRVPVYEISAAALLLLVAAGFVIYHRQKEKIKLREEELLEQRRREESRIKSEMAAMKADAEKLKRELEDEKRRVAAAATKSAARDQELIQNSIKTEIGGLIEKVKAVSQEPVPSRRKNFASRKKPIPVLDFLPDYTDIPISTPRLGEMIKKAKDSKARCNLLWALGNKKDMQAVEILAAYIGDSKGDELKESLKALKRISLRPDSPPEVKNRIETVFASQRRRGIIV